MTLRKKTSLIISIISAALLVILFTASQVFVLASFDRLEEQHTQNHVERIRRSLFNDFMALDAFVFDWSAWDDTYEFIDTGNEEFLASNLVDETFTTPRLNLILFVNAEYQIVFGKSFDLDEEQEVPVPQSLLSHLSAESPLLNHPDPQSGTTGILLLPEGPMLVASRPILTSEEQGPIRGSLLMGRYLNSTEIDRLAEITGQSLTVYRFDAPQLPSEVHQIQAMLSKDSPIVVQALNAKELAGYTFINDIYGKPALLLQTNVFRDIHTFGQTSVRHFILSSVVLCIVFGMTILLLLEKTVLSRLAGLIKIVSKIQVSSDLSKRVSITGEDELTNLAGAINGMLTALQTSQKNLQKREALYRGLVETSPDAIMVSDLTGKLTTINQRAVTLHGYENIEEMLEQDACELGTLESTQSALKEARKILEAGNIKTVECTIRKPDNTCFPAEISTSVLVDAHGAPMAFIDVVRDITKRKQLENELQTYHTYLEELANKRTTKLKTANEQLQLELDEYKKNEKELRQAYSELQAMFRAFPDMYFRLASDGTILDYTTEPGISSRFPESLLKKRIQDIFPHDVGHQFELAMPRALRKNERIRIEYEVPVPDNDEYYEEARILPVLDDQILVIIREITEHKKMEKLLRECKENLRTLSSQRNEEDIEVQGN